MRTHLDAIVLMVSADFLASDCIQEEEVPNLLQASQERRVPIITLLVSNCLWHQTAIAKFQIANDISRPLDRLTPADRHHELAKVSDKLESLLDRGAPAEGSVAAMPLGVVVDSDVDNLALAEFLAELSVFYSELTGGDELIIREGKVPLQQEVLT